MNRCESRRTPLMLLCLVVLFLVFTTTLVGAKDDGATRRQEIRDALRYLVAAEEWRVQTQDYTRADLLKRMAGADEARRDRSFVGLRAMSSLQARLLQTRSMVLISVYEFESPEHAAQFIAAAGDAARVGKSMPGVKIEVRAWGDGAGPEDTLPGFHHEWAATMAAGVTTTRMQTAQRDRYVIQVGLHDAGFIDRRAHEEAMARADAFVRDPTSARKRPQPELPRPPTGFRTLLVYVVGPEGQAVAQAKILATIEPKPRGLRDLIEGECLGGRCRLRVPPKRGTIRVWQARDAAGAQLPLRPSGHVEYAKDATEVRIALQAGHSIQGQVEQADGKPAVGLIVKAKSRTDRANGLRDFPVAIFDGQTETDAEGRFTLRGLRDEEYSLTLERNGTPATSQEIRAEPGCCDVEIRLHPTKTIRLTLLDYRGEPVAWASARARQVGGGSWHDVSGVSGRDGVVALEAMDPSEPHFLEIQPGASDAPVVSVERGQWMPRDETITLARGWTLRGVVHDAQGKPTPAQLHLRNEDGKIGRQAAPEDGVFKIKGLPYGAVDVAALPEDELLIDRKNDISWAWTHLEVTATPVILTRTQVLRTPKKKRDE